MKELCRHLLAQVIWYPSVLNDNDGRHTSRHKASILLCTAPIHGQINGDTLRPGSFVSDDADQISYGCHRYEQDDHECSYREIENGKNIEQETSPRRELGDIPVRDHRTPHCNHLPSGMKKRRQMTPLLCLLKLNLNDPIGNRTRVTSVKGKCLNLLTMGPYGGGGWIRTTDPSVVKTAYPPAVSFCKYYSSHLLHSLAGMHVSTALDSRHPQPDTRMTVRRLEL